MDDPVDIAIVTAWAVAVIYTIFTLILTKKRRFKMGKNGKQKEAEIGDGGPTIINQNFEAVKPKYSSLLILEKIVEPNVRSEEHPNVSFVAVAVRADAIDLVEPATYATDYQFVQPVATGNPRDSYFLSRNMYDAFMGRTYWIPQGTEPCVRVYIAGGPDYLVKGDVHELKDRIDFLEA